METLQQTTNKFWGIVNYEVKGDGCFNGIWTNNDANKGGVIMNEIARKNDNNPNEIIGDYYVSWIEPNQPATFGFLKISPNGIAYDFEWLVDNTSMFKGIGMQVGLHQVIAFYWKTGDTFCI